MLFPTATFAAFFVAVYAAHTMLRRQRQAWMVAMVAASLVFYGWWEPRLTVLLVASAAFNHTAALVVAARRRAGAGRVALAVAVAANLAVLGWFKYAGFFATAVLDAAGAAGVQLGFDPPDVLLPIGISFFTFQAISYLVDVSRGQLEPARNPTETTLYLSFFPQLVAGPIVRAKPFFDQIRGEWPRPSASASVAGMLILSGLVKKIVIADALWGLATPVGANPFAYTSLDVLVHLYAGMVRVFCDVSSYTDMALGFGLLLGIELPENFRKPFAASSLSEFWRRWHLSLSRWLRDYLFEPLRGVKPSGRRLAAAGMLTMVLSGLWHGAGWAFLVWGALHGTVLVVEGAVRMRRIRARRRRSRSRARHVLGVVATFHFVALTGSLFTGRTLAETGAIFSALAGDWTSATILSPMLVACLAVGIGLHFVPPNLAAPLARRIDTWPAALQGAAFAVAVTAIAAIGLPGVAPYIYYRF